MLILLLGRAIIKAKNLSEKHYNLDHEVLSRCFTKCIEWGARDDHPMTNKKVVKFPSNSSTRYVEDWELAEFFKVAPLKLVLFCRLVGLIGQDKGDILRIRLTDIKPDCLVIEPRHKTKRKRKTTRKRSYPFYTEEGQPTGQEALLNEIKALPHPVGGRCGYSAPVRASPT